MHYIFCCKACEKSNTNINFCKNTIDQDGWRQKNNAPYSIEQKYINIFNLNQISLNKNINNIKYENDQVHNQVNNQSES